MMYESAVGLPESLIFTSFIVLILALALVVFCVVSVWKVYEKVGLKGWTCLIPVYSEYALAKVLVNQNFAIACGATAALMLCITYDIPLWIEYIFTVAHFITSAITARYLSEGFGHGVGMTLALIFVPFIAYPILAFSKNEEFLY